MSTGEGKRKTDDILRSLTPERKREIGEQIEELLRGEMRFITRKYLVSYQGTVRRLFGWMQEDLLQYIRMEMWQGLATYDASKGAKVATYLSAVLYYYFNSLTRTCHAHKHSKTQLLLDDEMDQTHEQEEPISIEELVDGSQSMTAFLASLSAQEIEVVQCFHIERNSAREVGKKIGINRLQVLELSKQIRMKLKNFIRETQDEEDTL